MKNWIYKIKKCTTFLWAIGKLAILSIPRTYPGPTSGLRGITSALDTLQYIHRVLPVRVILLTINYQLHIVLCFKMMMRAFTKEHYIRKVITKPIVKMLLKMFLDLHSIRFLRSNFPLILGFFWTIFWVKE